MHDVPGLGSGEPDEGESHTLEGSSETHSDRSVASLTAQLVLTQILAAGDSGITRPATTLARQVSHPAGSTLCLLFIAPCMALKFHPIPGALLVELPAPLYVPLLAYYIDDLDARR